MVARANWLDGRSRLAGALERSAIQPNLSPRPLLAFMETTRVFTGIEREKAHGSKICTHACWVRSATFVGDPSGAARYLGRSLSIRDRVVWRTT